MTVTHSRSQDPAAQMQYNSIHTMCFQPHENGSNEELNNLNFIETNVDKRKTVVVLNFFRLLLTFRLTLLHMRHIFKIINVQRNDKAFFVYMLPYGLFVNSSVVHTVKSCLKCRSVH